MKNLLKTALLLALACPVSAGEALKYDSRDASTDAIFDPVFQDYIETSDGYKSARSRAILPLADIRDSVISSTAVASKYSGAVAKDVFVTITARPDVGNRFIKELASTSGFKLSGERTTYTKEGRKTVYLGWAKPIGLTALCGNAGIASVNSGSGASARSACAGL